MLTIQIDQPNESYTTSKEITGKGEIFMSVAMWFHTNKTNNTKVILTVGQALNKSYTK